MVCGSRPDYFVIKQKIFQKALTGSHFMTLFRWKLPALLQLKEAENIMQILCESGWLVPVKDSMSATTVMMRNK